MPLPAATSSPPVVYISYARKDRFWRDRIIEHLKPLQADGIISLWDDQSIAPGEDWQRETEKALEVAHVALVLISEDALTSDFINNQEIPAFKRRRVRLIPVLVETCFWQGVPWLASLQVYPRDARPLGKLLPIELANALRKLAQEVGEAVKRASPKKKASFKLSSQSGATKSIKKLGSVFGISKAVPPELLRSLKELKEIKSYLLHSRSKPKPQIIGICGPKGIGKTTLASVIAHDDEVRQAFPDGLFYVSSTPKGELKARIRNILSVGLPGVTKASSDTLPLILNRKILLIINNPDIEDGSNFSQVEFLARFSCVLIATQSRRNLERLQARIFDIGPSRLTRPDSLEPHEALAEPPPSQPLPTAVEPKTRRIIQSHLVSTTCVAADGEAEQLTPTAQRCMLALREFLISDETHPPLTVAVEAPWGGGKSSLMRHLQDALTNSVDKNIRKCLLQEGAFPTVWFNPWKHEAGKTLWAAFAVAFERQMAENCGVLERPWKRICLSVKRLETMEKIQLVLRFAFWIVALISLGCIAYQQSHAGAVKDWKEQMLQHAPWLGMIVTLWAFLKDAVKQLGSPLKLDVSRLLTHNDHSDKVDDLHRFHEDFRRMIRAYVPKRKNGKVGKAFVFIDDLDRCEAPKAAELLQSLHLMLNVQECSRSTGGKDPPGIICVLGMDRKKVAAAVAAKHEKLLPLLMKTDANGKVSQEEAMVFGHEFLEKFIQLTLHLPAMQGRDLDEYLESIIGATEKKTQLDSLTDTMDQDNPTTATEAVSSVTAQVEIEHQEQQAAVERIESVSEDLEDGSLVLQCARYAAVGLENNPRKLKQFVNLFRLRLYLAAAMDFLDLPDRDADKPDVEPLRSSPKDKLSVHHLAKLVALELAAPSEMTAIREISSQNLFAELEKSFPADTKPSLHALLAYRDPLEPEAYDLSKAALPAYFHYFKTETPTA